MARTKTPPRVVLDTNVVLSALIFGGGPGRLRPLWQSGHCVPLISAETAAELMRALAYPKFDLDDLMQEELLADYLPYADAVRIPEPPPTVPKCRDPFDLAFLRLADAGKAKMLLTGDKDLLTLGGQTPFAILRVEAFFKLVGA